MIPQDAKSLIELVQFNHDLIHQQLSGVTHAESLLQPPFRGNCMNWVTGHILDVRNEFLVMLGLPGVMTEDEKKRYGYGSDPITEAAQAVDLGSLIERLDQSLAAIVSKLGSMSQADLDREASIWRGPMPLIQALGFLHWHESYHTGQLELLRQLAGKNDHVI
jgi:uncharacterized damage-inducible protein DinB